jgi:hypothetical protein
VFAVPLSCAVSLSSAAPHTHTHTRPRCSVRFRRFLAPRFSRPPIASFWPLPHALSPSFSLSFFSFVLILPRVSLSNSHRLLPLSCRFYPSPRIWSLECTTRPLHWAVFASQLFPSHMGPLLPLQATDYNPTCVFPAFTLTCAISVHFY